MRTLKKPPTPTRSHRDLLEAAIALSPVYEPHAYHSLAGGCPIERGPTLWRPSRRRCVGATEMVTRPCRDPPRPRCGTCGTTRWSGCAVHGPHMRGDSHGDRGALR